MPMIYSSAYRGYELIKIDEKFKQCKCNNREVDEDLSKLLDKYMIFLKPEKSEFIPKRRYMIGTNMSMIVHVGDSKPE